jgi:D-aminoacyl-tRNA deacylase
MRVVIQRVRNASVTIDNQVRSSIGHGLLVLLGIEEVDTDEDSSWLISKIVNLRIFNDQQGVMNCSILETGGDILVVSQFTLHASTKKGNRPSYIKAAKPNTALPLYERFLLKMNEVLGKSVFAGEFGADMQVALLNDGPVTIIIDTKNKD